MYKYTIDMVKHYKEYTSKNETKEEIKNNTNDSNDLPFALLQ